VLLIRPDHLVDDIDIYKLVIFIYFRILITWNIVLLKYFRFILYLNMFS
jgi:hypothetical protein